MHFIILCKQYFFIIFCFKKKSSRLDKQNICGQKKKSTVLSRKSTVLFLHFYNEFQLNVL